MNSLDRAISNISRFTNAPECFRVENDELIPILPAAKTAQESKKLIDFLTRQVTLINACSSKELCKCSNDIRDLFFRVLIPFEYDRKAIAPGGPLEGILDETVSVVQLAPDEEDPVSKKKIHATMAETKFALRLGVKPERIENEYHLAYYLLDRSGNRLGVFKPRERKIFIRDRYGSAEIREAHLAEVANSKIDRLLGFGLVPYTELLTCKPENRFYTGSFQFYVKDAPFLYDQLKAENLYDPDHEALKARLNTPDIKEMEFPNFESFALFDLITGNNDHHFTNILIKRLGQKKWDLVAIDNGNSFPWTHDRDLRPYKTHPLHWFKWSALPQAQSPFSDSMVAQINQLDGDKIEEIMRAELVHKDVPSSKTHIEKKVKVFRDRLAGIRELANRRVAMAEIASALLHL